LGESISTTDYHTAGEPFRIVTAGVPSCPGRTVLEKRRWAAAHLDHVRRLLVNEPRGHADMYGCFVVEPDDAGADLGVLFFHNGGFSTACGHGTIALVTWALESGTLPRPGVPAKPDSRGGAVEGVPGEAGGGGTPVTDDVAEVEVTVDVPSGRLPTWARVRTGTQGLDVLSVRFRNVPSFVAARGVVAAGRTVDVAFGGAFYAIAPALLPIDAAHLPALIERGRAIKDELNAEGRFVHPREPDLRDIYGVIWTDGSRNVTVFADGEVDRSPCGSGTSARLALLDAGGELPRGDVLHHRGIVGTEFTARVVGSAEVAGLPAVITEVEGSAHLTGRHEFVLEAEDPLGTGFLLR
jgi:proline racemase